MMQAIYGAGIVKIKYEFLQRHLLAQQVPFLFYGIQTVFPLGILSVSARFKNEEIQ